ncbi:MAG: hypothetical protein COA52_19885 [Hyphomicrobiales bacterium]|nr:MAG: hypothetical protein COA52_19885 [Hyphomicrobiales bacterium]
MHIDSVNMRLYIDTVYMHGATMFIPRISLFMMAFLSITIALASYRFLALGLPLAFNEMPGHIENRLLAFVVHISAAPVALLVGSLQMLPKLRSWSPVYHRWAGRLYGVAVLVGSVSGLIIAFGAEGGVAAQVGFSMLALVWLWVTVKAVIYARNRQIADHRRWMIRSFALTFAGVTLRLQLLGFMFAGFEYNEASVYLAWLCWIPNLIAVEWWLRRRRSSLQN